MSNLNPDSFGRIRVVVAGNTGAGKTALSEFITTGRHQQRPTCTAGCNILVKLLDYKEQSGAQQRYFVELLDIGTHHRYQALRRMFYQQINGVILVHDVMSGGKVASLQRWAMEITEQGTFSAALLPEVAAVNLGGLPVPVLILYNKVDKLDGQGSSSANALAWLQQAIQKQLHRPPMSRSGSLKAGNDEAIAGLHTSATEGKIDMAAVDDFFTRLIERRYYGSNAADASGLPLMRSPALQQRPGHERSASCRPTTQRGREDSWTAADSDGRLDALEGEPFRDASLQSKARLGNGRGGGGQRSFTMLSNSPGSGIFDTQDVV